MFEEQKLAEANYFYSRMMSEVGDRIAFVFDLSAFLSSARSVLQYALKEAEKKKDGQQWYDNHIINSRILSFFKDKRNINIHTEPVKTDIPLTTIERTLNISTSLSWTITDTQSGKVESEYHEPLKPQSESRTKITHRFTFPDWNGSEDILTLCQKYLDELKMVVSDGLNKKILTKQ